MVKYENANANDGFLFQGTIEYEKYDTHFRGPTCSQPTLPYF